MVMHACMHADGWDCSCAVLQLGIDAEFTRPATVQFLHDFKAKVEGLNLQHCFSALDLSGASSAAREVGRKFTGVNEEDECTSSPRVEAPFCFNCFDVHDSI